jgi:hypothetical protein
MTPSALATHVTTSKTANIFQNGLDLQDLPEIPIPGCALLVDQECMARVLTIPSRRRFTVNPTTATPLGRLAGCRSKTPRGEVGAVATGIGLEDGRSISFRVGGDGGKRPVLAPPQ